MRFNLNSTFLAFSAGVFFIATFLSTGCIWFGKSTPTTPEASPTETSQQTAVEPEPQGEITIRWTTYWQNNVDRFEVYRGESRDGPWEMVSGDELIQGEAFLNSYTGETEPVEYVFTDDGLKAGEAYWYYIGKVDLTGRRSRYTRNPKRWVAVDPAVVAAEAKTKAMAQQTDDKPTTDGDATQATPTPTPTPTPAAPVQPTFGSSGVQRSTF
jgi:hypothetical protein